MGKSVQYIYMFFSLGGGRRAVLDHVGYLTSQIGAHGDGPWKSHRSQEKSNTSPKHAQESSEIQ